MSKVADWTSKQVLGHQKWAPHLTVDEMRKILTHWETHHPELLVSTDGFKLGEAMKGDGTMVAAWGFEWLGMFVVNARISDCGRFHAAASDYQLSEADADRLAMLNAGKDLMAYWEI